MTILKAICEQVKGTFFPPPPLPPVDKVPLPTSLAAIVKAHGQEVFDRSSVEQRRALEKIVTCQTVAQGVHRRSCGSCLYQSFVPNSCRSRYCPRCLGAQQAKWFDARTAELLEVPYFHVVFTLPHELGPLALCNQKELYTLLFRAASRTLLQLGKDPKRLGAQLGFLAVLHTWGQNLLHHPHIHCVVPGGGLDLTSEEPEGYAWVPSRPSYLFPVQVLSKLFKGKFLAGLRQLYDTGELTFQGGCASLQDRRQFENLLRKLSSKGWVVYAKPPFAGPKQVLAYLARYTHRIAISEARIVAFEDGVVTFRWKDYSDGAKKKMMKLKAAEFLRRYLLHVLPPGFHRLRYYGFFGNRYRKERLELCRQLIQPSPSRPPEAEEGMLEILGEAKPKGASCPKCGGSLQFDMVSRPNPASIRPFRFSTGPPP